MVERMTSVEIEDVLSSIRRLVTDDLRPKPVPVVDSKLILTPALRVVPETMAEPPAAADETLEVDLDADLAAALLDDPAGNAVTDPATDADLSDQTQSDEPYPMFLHHDRRVDLTPAPLASEVGETVMTIGAGIPAEGYEAELGDVMPVPEWPESSWVAPDVIDGVEEAEVIALPDAGDDMLSADWADDTMDSPLLADLGHDVGHDQLSDEVADDLAAAAAMAALAADDAAQESVGITELDEEMLRDIVRDIIREELQGPLGEKITRNVRKLVRAEINRAMLLDDLE